MIAAVPSLADRKQMFTLPQFRLGGRYDLERPQSFANGGEDGTPLERLGAPPLQLGAITLGTPIRDGAGKIINAVVILGDDWGDATSLYARWVEGRGERGERYPPPVAPGALIDTDRHYVVLLDSLGLFGPATPAAGLGPDFPRYSLFDGVQAGYRLLRDHLNVGEVRLVTGASLGGAATWAWAALHPEWVGAAMPVAGTPAGDGDDPVARWTLQLMAAAIEADPAWRISGGRYHALPKAEHPQRGVMFGFSLFDLLTHGLATSPAAATDIPVFSWSAPPAEGTLLARRAASHDAADLLWRIRAAIAFTVTPHLARIRAQLLAIHRADDPWLSAEKTAAAVRRVAGGEMITLPPDGASGRDPLPALAALTGDATMQAFRERAGLSGDARIRAPGLRTEPPRLVVADAPEQRPSLPRALPARLTDPFPARVHEVADSAGRRWPIAVIDVAAAGADTPPAAAATEALLILPDRGLPAAAYGETIAFAARRGLRVIAPELPPHGLSGAPVGAEDTNPPPARTLADQRAILADLMRGPLGITRVTCLGHGRGAQLCLGLGLDHADLVTRLILVAPEGLSTVPRQAATANGSAPLFDPALAADAPKAPAFVRDGAIARAVADLYDSLAAAGGAERDRFASAFAFDAYAAGIERLDDDPLNLPARAARLTQPVMIAVGARDPLPLPLVPERPEVSAAAVIGGFVKRLAAAGNPPVLRIYPAAGTAVPMDVPVAFASDVVEFVAGRPVREITPEIIDSLLTSAGKPATALEPAASSPIRREARR